MISDPKKQETMPNNKPTSSFAKPFLITLFINLGILVLYAIPTLLWLFDSTRIGEGAVIVTCLFSIVHGIVSLIVANKNNQKGNRGSALALVLTGLLLLFIGIVGGLFILWAIRLGSGWHN
jgi:heme/copper-type cytochrome/quinol oxidase subunit 4